MPDLTLTLDGHPVDLPASAQVALSYLVNDVRHIESREAAVSASFTLPLTALNRQVLGNPHDLASLTTAPYRLLPAVLRSPGGMVLLNGYGIVLRASDIGYEIRLTDGAGALAVLVGGRKLRELDLQQYDHPLTYSALQAADTATAGYTYALFDTGVLAGRPINFDLTPDELPASVFVQTLLRAMLTDPLPPVPLPAGYQPPTNPLAGWRLTGSLLTDELYQATVLPRATAYPQLRAAYRHDYSVKAATATPQVYTLTSGTGVLQFPRVVSGGAVLLGEAYYSPPAHAVNLNIKVRLPVTWQGPGGFISLLQQDAPSAAPILLRSFPFDANAGYKLTTLDLTLPVVQAGPQTRLFLQTSIFDNSTTVTIGAGATVTYTLLPRALPGAPVHLDAGLPDLSQADLLKWLFTAFNVIIQAEPVTRTLRLDLSNQLETQRYQPVDWTDRLDLTRRPRLTYRLPDYAQANVFQYAEQPDEVSDELLPVAEQAQGTGSLAVTDATLPGTREAFTTDLLLPLEHPTGFARLPLLWLPFFALADPAKAAVLWDSQHAYSRGDLVIYLGQTWLCTIGDGQTTTAVPPSGNNRAFQVTDQAWQPAPDAWPVANEHLPAVARLLPNSEVRVMESGLHGAAYSPARQLSRQGLGFDDALTAYWPTFARCCERLALLEVDLRLTGLDISGLDFTVPRKIGPIDIPHYGRLSLLGYLNLIDQYQPGQRGAVAVQLLVLGAPVAGLAPAVSFPVQVTQRAFETEDAQYYLLSEDGYYLLPE